MVEEIANSATAAMNEGSDKSIAEAGAGGKEGEIAAGDSDAAVAQPKPAPTRHPLENSWTFWFDNPSAKSRQAAWGSSIRPVYTFSSVEDFWR